MAERDTAAHAPCRCGDPWAMHDEAGYGMCESDRCLCMKYDPAAPAPKTTEDRRFDVAVDALVDLLSEDRRSAFWAFIDGSITVDEYMAAIR